MTLPTHLGNGAGWLMKLTARECKTVRVALVRAIEYEDTVIDAHSADVFHPGLHRPVGRKPMKGYAYVVRRSENNIRRYRALLLKLRAAQ